LRLFVNTLATSGDYVHAHLAGKKSAGATPAGDFKMGRLLSRFLSDQSGATAIEYCLIATGIAFAIIATVQGIGPQLNTKFTSINTSLK
jgi:pilus assembly protein Flp/PilA